MIFTSIVTHLFYRLSPYWNCYGEYCYEQLIWYRELGFNLSVVSGMLWMAAWAFLEIRTLRRLGRPIPKLLTHLRYGPIFTLVFSIAASIASDLFLIQYSRWQIVRYIHSDAPVTETPTLKLHNNYRGWCGNGYSAHEYYLYGDTPAAYIDDPDPATRARALQASMYVYDWLNQPNDGPSITALKKATADPDPMVRDVAAKFSAELYDDGVP
jgi:hypothetical protein